MEKKTSGSSGDMQPFNASSDVSRRAAPRRSQTVTSGGSEYQKSMVGDRLEYSFLRSRRASAVTHEDYADYLNSFSGASLGKKGSSGISRSDYGRSDRRGSRRRKGRGADFDSAPPGNPIKDVTAKYLPKFSVRLTASIISAIVAGLLVYQVFMSLYVDYSTEKVTISPYLETIDVEGIAIRDEYLIEGSLSKTSVKVINNGDKVSKGEAIVNIFSSTSEAEAYERVSEIDRETGELRSMVTASEDSVNTVELIGKQLDLKMVDLNDAARRKDMSSAAALKDEISYLLNKRLVAMRQVEDYNSRIEQLEKEKEELQQKYSKEPKTVTAPDSGYFTDSCDGYETLLNTSMVADLTVDKLNEIMNKEVKPSEKTIGKLVGSFTWYLACPVPAKDSDFLIKDSIYTLYLPYSKTESIKAVLQCVNKVDGQDTFLALFRCSSLASELCTVRSQPVKIVKCSYEGFAIQKSALHAGVKYQTHRNPHPEEDFPRGHLVYVTQTTYPSVYVLVAGQIREKEVNIIYGTDKLVICTPIKGDQFLSLGDTVVIAERGLYNGKIVN